MSTGALRSAPNSLARPVAAPDSGVRIAYRRWLPAGRRRNSSLALRILRSQVSRPSPSVSEPAFCPWRHRR